MKKILRYKNGNALSYAEFGSQDGYPILIQHGLIASIDDYDLFEELIGSGARLICIARPGYGESSPYVMKNFGEWGEIVSILIDDLRLSQFDVLGISSGAPYSYAIGCRHADKVRNIFILSGMPALYDENIRAIWPYPLAKDASMAEMQKLARELFFSDVFNDDLAQNDIRDSMMNDCFGVAQDLRLRGMDWGFRLSDVRARVIMRHSKADRGVPLAGAELTSKLLPVCTLEIRENEEHFSRKVLSDYINTSMAGWYQKTL